MRNALNLGATNINEAIDRLLTIDYHKYYPDVKGYVNDIYALMTVNPSIEVRADLRSSPSPNSRILNNQLYLAVRDDSPELVKIFIDAGADDVEGALQLAYRLGKDNIVRLLY
jgi:hypothetical protein